MSKPTKKTIVPERLSGANPGLEIILNRWKARDVDVMQRHTTDEHAGDILRDCETCAELFTIGQTGADELEAIAVERGQRIASRVHRGSERRG